MDRNEQCELAFSGSPRTRTEVVAMLNDGSGGSVEVAFTRNRVSMVSVSMPIVGPMKVRLHEQFRQAPQSVLVALRRYLRTRRRDAWREVTAYADTIEADSRHTTKAAGDARGEHHDLTEIMSEVNKEFFGGRVSCSIRWGSARPRKRGRRRWRSIRFGSWSTTTRTVRVHPLLDDSRVPREFVRYIVFHEMLHSVVPTVAGHGRRLVHTPQFNALERAYPDIKKMYAMTERLVDVIL